MAMQLSEGPHERLVFCISFEEPEKPKNLEQPEKL